MANYSSIMFSFYSDDSYEYIPAGHDFKSRDGKKFALPKSVPKLNFEDLPEYESSSDEEDAENQQPREEAYVDGMQYIDNYYDKVNVLERSPDTANAAEGSPACRNAPSRPETANLTRVVSESLKGAEFGLGDGEGFDCVGADSVAMPFP